MKAPTIRIFKLDNRFSAFDLHSYYDPLHERPIYTEFDLAMRNSADEYITMMNYINKGNNTI